MDVEMKLLQEKFNTNPNVIKKVPKPMPPIIITQGLKQPKETHQKIQGWISNKLHFKIKAGNTEIITYTVDDHTTIQDKLREVQIEFITSAPRNTQNKRMVLKGIDKTYSTEEILSDLQGQGVKAIRIEQLVSKKSGESSDRNPCSVWFSPDTNVGFVTRNIKYCCHHRIQWANFVSPRVNRTIQCFRCQEPGHKAQFCGKRFRCVKCISVHEPGQCPKKSEEKPRCVNCQLFHPANYHGCIILKEYGRRSHPSRTTKINDNTKTKQSSSSSSTSHPHNNRKYVNHQKSKNTTTMLHSHLGRGTYSQVLTNEYTRDSRDVGNTNTQSSFSNIFATSNSGRSDKKSQNSDVFSFLQSETSDLFGVSLLDFMKLLKEFVPKYKSETDDMSKKFLIIEFLSMFV